MQWNWITHVVAPRGSKRQNEPFLDELFLGKLLWHFLWYFLLSEKAVVIRDYRPRSSDVWDKYYVPIHVSRQVRLPSSASDCTSKLPSLSIKFVIFLLSPKEHIRTCKTSMSTSMCDVEYQSCLCHILELQTGTMVLRKPWSSNKIGVPLYL